jgi:hypothetical protein
MDQIEWDYRSTLIELRPGDGTAEPFFIHLFKGCVLFESLLKANSKDIPPPTRHTLGRVLQYLHSHLSTPANIDIGGTDFPTIPSDLSAADHSITTAVKFAGKVRNTVGHNLGWKATLEKWQYDLLAKMIALHVCTPSPVYTGEIPSDKCYPTARDHPTDKEIP